MARNHKIDASAVLERVQRDGPEALVTRGEAAAILDLLLEGASSYERRKQIGNQLDVASRPRGRRGRIPSIPKTASGFTANDLVDWVKDLYAQDLIGVPRKPRKRHFIAHFNDVAVASDRVELVSYPGTIERCHDELRRALTEIRELKLALAATERELSGKWQPSRDPVTGRFSSK